MRENNNTGGISETTFYDDNKILQRARALNGLNPVLFRKTTSPPNVGSKVGGTKKRRFWEQNSFIITGKYFFFNQIRYLMQGKSDILSFLHEIKVCPHLFKLLYEKLRLKTGKIA